MTKDSNQGGHVWKPEELARVFEDGLETYERAHPHWRIEVFVSLVKWGLRCLKHYIEDGDENAITWDSPFVRLHYPVDWDWETSRSGYVIHGSFVSGKITRANTATKELTCKTLATAMAYHHNAMALHDFTNGVWFEKVGKRYQLYLPPELDRELCRIKDKRQRREALEEICQPLSFGAAAVDIDYGALRNGDRIPKRAAKLLAKEIPRIGISGNVNGRKFEMSLVFQIHPLNLDYAAKSAFYPIVVGLFFQPDEHLKTRTPAKWPKKDRDALWNGLLTEITKKLTDRFIPKSESKTSDIIKVNATLEVPTGQSHIILEALNSKSKVLHFQQTSADLATARPIVSKEPFDELLASVEAAKTSDEKGRTLENLIAALFKSVAGFEKIERRIHTETEEIDLSIENESDDARFRREKAIILVECKNWSSKCGKNEFVAFKEKMKNRSGRCSLGFMISWNGFCETVTKEMLRSSHDDYLVVPIDGSTVPSAIRNGSFLELLKSAWNKATRI